jgi:hypothetical protein
LRGEPPNLSEPEGFWPLGITEPAMYNVKRHGAGWAILADEAVVMLFDSYDEALEVALCDRRRDGHADT